MRAVLIAFALAAMAPLAAAQEPDADAVVLTDYERQQMNALLELSSEADGRVTNACGDKVTLDVKRVDLGNLGNHLVVVVPAGTTAPACYGDGPGDVYVVRYLRTDFSVIFNGQGYIALLPNASTGIPDIALGGPGQAFPVHTFSRTRYVRTNRTISDATFARAATILP
ncbi:MAG: hypothetical protein SGJ23_08035 [Alphaproteobacteria bacterium]|nr:hypothetical protein [Alphaproteobacteria bacterium]